MVTVGLCDLKTGMSIKSKNKRTDTMLRNVVKCPICGRPHDDGVNVEVEGKELFLCFDCFDEIVKKEPVDEPPAHLV